MKALVLGSSGFIGRNVVEELKTAHEVFVGYRGAMNADELDVDLSQPESIAHALETVRPDLVVNCAGIVENGEKAKLNEVFTQNLLQAIIDTHQNVKKIVVLGSAGEYGFVDPSELPVREDAPLRATSPYGMSKVEEVKLALRYREEYGLPVVVARLFNPIGNGMPDRQLIPGILRQLSEVKAGRASAIEISRLDSKRDYIDVRDVATAIHALLTSDTTYGVYNVGSGKQTSNADLIEYILKYDGLSERPTIMETSNEPERGVASQADISRLRELGWEPKRSVEEVIMEIMHVE